MNDDNLRLLLAAAIAVCEIYAMDPTRFPVFAWFWDFIAKVTGTLANALGYVAVQARLNYFEAVRNVTA